MQDQDQALLLAILETAVDAIIVIDRSAIIQLTNAATTTLFGYQRADMIGRNVNMLMPSPYRDHHDHYVKNYLQTGHAKIIGIGREVVGQRSDGSTFPMHLAVSEFQFGNDRWFAGIVRDISDLKHAQQQLAVANEALEARVQERTSELHAAQAELVKATRLATLGQVSGGIAHEIRNPLNALRTSIYFLLHANQPTPEKVAEHLARMDRQISMIDSVVTALTDVARLPEPLVSTFHPLETLRHALSTVNLPASIDVRFETEGMDPSGDPVRVFGDPNQISIVYRNLIRNARDAMRDGGTLTITALDCGEESVVQISDSGIGIAAEEIERITEPLYSTKARGMGLGLSISVEILKKNQGRLEIQSRIGEGTVFSVFLKRVAGASEP